VDIYTPDFLTIARGFGCRAQRAESLHHLRWLLQQSDQESGPTLIEIDEEEALAW
jgi:acetolactate synthase-1/2/3 large subunit